ncbi:MAG: biotin transporter BioY [Rhizobiaceae bacterium]|nr:biotin transporter BioY [Rhizobiaceae bacterium]
MSITTTNGALAGRSISQTGYREILYPALVIFGIALIALSAKIQIPFWPVPMTLQTLAIAGLAAAYGLRLGLVTIVAYLAAGYMGAPVFAGPAAGPLYFAGPTAGFLAGFVVLTAIVGYVADRVRSENFLALLSAMIVGDAILFALGFAWLAYIFVGSNGNTLGEGTAWNIINPFIAGDVFKMILAAALVPAISSLMRRKQP